MLATAAIRRKSLWATLWGISTGGAAVVSQQGKIPFVFPNHRLNRKIVLISQLGNVSLKHWSNQIYQTWVVERWIVPTMSFWSYCVGWITKVNFQFVAGAKHERHNDGGKKERLRKSMNDSYFLFSGAYLEAHESVFIAWLNKTGLPSLPRVERVRVEHFPRHTVADSQWEKKQNKTNQSQIWKNDGVSIAAPEETNNILAKLSQHLQISISRNTRRRCQVHTSGSSHVQGVNINFERHSVRFACISFARRGYALSRNRVRGRGRRGSLQFSLLKLFVMQIGSAHYILPFDSKCAAHVTRAGCCHPPPLTLKKNMMRSGRKERLSRRRLCMYRYVCMYVVGVYRLRLTSQPLITNVAVQLNENVMTLPWNNKYEAEHFEATAFSLASWSS